ncbi:MAG: TlpA disulfide reductase family protein [Halofilum sp. (in: g-proteobacteria)]
MNRPVWLLVVAAALAGLAAGLAVNLWLQQAPETPATTPAGEPEQEVIGEPRPGFTLPAPDGSERSIGEFDGDVVLINFWATWCAPCVREVPALVETQAALGERGLQVVGVALDDAEPVREFAAEHDINYPLMVGGRDAFDIGSDYGNARGVLPYTVLVDRDGVIRETHLGALTHAQMIELVEPFL